MDAALKVVTQLPLAELWRDDAFSTTVRVRWLTAGDIVSLLRVGPVQFVVADIGAPPRWLPLGECYKFWKTEVKPHLAAPESHTYLDDFPGGYCYDASEWKNSDGAAPIVVCERYH